MPSETEDLFSEIQDSGMDLIGTRVEFDMDGSTGYFGVINDPNETSQMLSGGYQGRAEMIIMATRSQFAANPSQKGVVTITAPDILSASQWHRKQVEVFGASHYAIWVMRQMPTT